MSRKSLGVIGDLWKSYQKQPSAAVLLHTVLAINFFLNDIVQAGRRHLELREGCVDADSLVPLTMPLLESAGWDDLPTSKLFDDALVQYELENNFAREPLGGFGLRFTLFTVSVDELKECGAINSTSHLNEIRKFEDGHESLLDDLKNKLNNLKNQRENTENKIEESKKKKKAMKVKKSSEAGSRRATISYFLGKAKSVTESIKEIPSICRKYLKNRKLGGLKGSIAKTRVKIVEVSLSSEDGSFAQLSEGFSDCKSIQQRGQYSRQVMYDFSYAKSAMRLPTEQTQYQEALRQLCKRALIQSLPGGQTDTNTKNSLGNEVFEFEKQRQKVLDILVKRLQKVRIEVDREQQEIPDQEIEAIKDVSEKVILTSLNNVQKTLKALPSQILVHHEFGDARRQIGDLKQLMEREKQAFFAKDSFWQSPVRHLAWCVAVVIHILATRTLTLLNYSNYVANLSFSYKTNLQRDIEKVVASMSKLDEKLKVFNDLKSRIDKEAGEEAVDSSRTTTGVGRLSILSRKMMGDRTRTSSTASTSSDSRREESPVRGAQV